MKKTRLDARKVVRKLARERVGAVPASRLIEPKVHKKPKHKRDPREDAES